MKTNTIGSTEIQPKTEGTKPFRIVLRFMGATEACPYVVHMETDPDTKGNGFHNGDYCKTMSEGYEALKVRAAKYGLRVLDANGKRVPFSKL